MKKTGVVINREGWLLLVEEPLYSIRFIDREGTQELAVVTRVEDLELFLEAPLLRNTRVLKTLIRYFTEKQLVIKESQATN